MAVERKSSDHEESKHTLKIQVRCEALPFWPLGIAHQLDLAGADALVMFNRFYQPDIDIKTRARAGRALDERRAVIELRWLAVFTGASAVARRYRRRRHTERRHQSAACGADVMQVVSALLRHGPGCISAMRLGLEHWMEWHTLTNLDEVRGVCGLKQTKDRRRSNAPTIRALQSCVLAPAGPSKS